MFFTLPTIDALEDECHSAAVGCLGCLHNYLSWMFFFPLPGLSKSVYKATLPYFLFFFRFPSCLIFSLYRYIA